MHTICFRVKRRYMKFASPGKCLRIISMPIPHSVFFPLKEIFIPQCVKFSAFLKWQLRCSLCYIIAYDHILSRVLREFYTTSYRLWLWMRKAYLAFVSIQAPCCLHYCQRRAKLIKWMNGQMKGQRVQIPISAHHQTFNCLLHYRSQYSNV